MSCIIPVWNGERYLAAAIDSVLQQTYRPIEVIVVDDGSTDGTAEIIARYGGSVRSVMQQQLGPGGARNAGIGLATGELLAFLDADDLWEPSKLERQVARLAANADHQLCVTGIRNFWIDELSVEREAMATRRLAEPQIGYSFSAVMARRTLLDRVGLLESELTLRDDREWFVTLRERRIDMAVIPDVLVHRRIHRSNLTRRMAPTALDELFEIARAGIARRRSAPGS